MDFREIVVHEEVQEELAKTAPADIMGDINQNGACEYVLDVHDTNEEHSIQTTKVSQ